MKCSGKWLSKLNKSPINYFSDLFIVAMVAMWIVDNVYESIVATAVTISSIILSHQSGMNCYDTSMWTSIGTNVAVPLSCGGAIWMIKNSVQHAISNYKGKDATQDFPAVYPEGEYETIELEQEMDMTSEDEIIEEEQDYDDSSEETVEQLDLVKTDPEINIPPTTDDILSEVADEVNGLESSITKF